MSARRKGAVAVVCPQETTRARRRGEAWYADDGRPLCEGGCRTPGTRLLRWAQAGPGCSCPACLVTVACSECAARYGNQVVASVPLPRGWRYGHDLPVALCPPAEVAS